MTRLTTFREVLRETLRREMAFDANVVLIGETIATRGGSRGVTKGLVKEFGPHRVRETPVSENVIVGAALGGALAGLTMVAEVYSADFLFAAGSEVINDIAKWRYQHRWKEPIRLVLRMPMGASGMASGPEHCQCIEGLLHHVPGLVVMVPGSVADAAGTLCAAIHCGDPVIVLEHRRLYDLEEEVDESALASSIEIGKGKIVREGSDCTVVAWGWMRRVAMEATARLEKDLSLELIDPITIKPLDFDLIARSVTKTGRLLVVEESPRTGSVAAEIITRVSEILDRPFDARRVTMPDVPHPYVPALEAEIIPDADLITAAITGLCQKNRGW